MLVINNDQWKLVSATSDEFSAEIIKGHLESADIEVQLISQLDSAKLLTIGEQAVVKIYVPIESYEQAKELLSNIEFDIDTEASK